MSYLRFTLLGLLTLLTVALFTACDKDDESDSERIERMIDEVRDVTEAYRSHDAGLAAGWNTDLSGCVEHPTEGGMGHHFARLEFMDGRVDHLEPQVLLYVPDQDSIMQFVAVEYIVPFNILGPDQNPPELFGEKFHKNEVQQIWALHVWTEKENPNGIFFDWNPDVDCN